MKEFKYVNAFPPTEQKLYKSTYRFGPQTKNYQLTEKMDGANLGFFRLGDHLFIAQRNRIFYLNTITLEHNIGPKSYAGLRDYVEDAGLRIHEDLLDGTGVFGEYMFEVPNQDKLHLEKDFYIFCKFKVKLSTKENEQERFETSHYNYDLKLLKYAFKEREVPNYFGTVPLVDELDEVSIELLDEIYNLYSKDENRYPEGFIVYDRSLNIVKKYVRYKGKKFGDHITPVELDRLVAARNSEKK